jgi:hypothetical protein
LLWVGCEPGDWQPGALILISSPEGERSARLVVTPAQALRPGPALAGYRALRALTPAQALLVPPAASLGRAAADRLAHIPDVAVCVAPDGSSLTLMARDPERLSPSLPELVDALGVPVVLRDPGGELPAPYLPPLLGRITHEGRPVIVEGLSVFHAKATLRPPGGEPYEVPLDSLDSSIPAP